MSFELWITFSLASAALLALGEAMQPELYARVLSVDDRSWKGLEDQGLKASNMAPFYEHMTAYLAERGTLRLVFARLDDEDIAICAVCAVQLLYSS